MSEDSDSIQQSKPLESNDEELARLKSESLYRIFFDNAADAIAIHDMGGKFLEVNRVLCERLGYSREELLQMTPGDISSPEHAAIFQQRVEALRKAGHAFFETVHVRRDGTTIPIEVSTRLIEYKGKPAVLSFTRDITERKKAEDALRESEERYRLLFEKSPVGIGLASVDGRIVSANEIMQAITGYSAKELREIRLAGTYENPADRERLLETLKRDGAVVNYPARLKRKDGTPYHALLSVSRISIAGKDLLQTTCIDITERKRTEDALRESEENFEALAENAFDGIMTVAGEGVFVYANERAAEITGYSVAELLKTTIKDLVHPDEFEKISERYRRRLEGRAAPSPYETVIIRKDGRSVPIELAATRTIWQRNPADQVFFRDITERKRMEEEIRSLARFPSENPNPVLRLDRHGTVLVANEASKALLQDWGSGIGQVAPKTWRDLAADALSSGESRNVDVEFGGKSYTFLVKPIMEAGYVNFYGRDITERKRAEEALRRRAEELAALQATVLDITGPHDLPILLHTIVERAARLLSAPAGGMYLCDPEKQEARCVVSYNTPHDYTGTVLKYGEGAAGIVAQTGEPLVVDDYRTWHGRATVFERERPFTAVLIVPMIWQGRVTGVIDVLDDTASRHFTRADQELLTLFANHAAIAVESTRLLEQEKRHAEELTRYSTNLERLVLERTRKLGESERRFRELSDLLPQTVFEIDEKGKVQFMNQAAFAASGCTEEEFRRGLNAFDLFAPAEQDRAIQDIRRIMTGETMGGHEFTALRRDGTTYPVIACTAPIMREGKAVGVRGIVIDITDRKRAEEELRAARDRLEYVVTSNPAVICSGKPLADYSDWHLTYISESVVALLGFEPKDFVGHPEFWDRHVLPEDVRHLRAEIPLLWKEGQHAFEYRFLHRDGTYRWIREEARVVRYADGKPIEVNGYWTDVSERKRLEEELVKSQRLATIGETSAMVGHDLRNPLQGIAGIVYLAKRDLESRKAADRKAAAALLDTIQEQIVYMDKIVSDLQDYSQPLAPKLTETNLPNLIRQTLSTIKIPKAVKVTVEIEKPAENAMIDPTLMRRTLTNLTINAIQAMPKKGKLTIRAHSKRDSTIMTVEDTGAGIPRKNLGKLFSPFFTTKAKGQGLGLPVCKRLVEAQGGTITVKSKPRKGTAFTIKMPRGRKEVTS